MKPKKLVEIVLFIIIILMIGGCSGMNYQEINEIYEKGKEIVSDNTADIAERAESGLAVKYQGEFKVIKVGNRINNETADVYVRPKDNSDIVFKARIGMENDELSDNYIERLVGTKLSLELKTALCDKSVESLSFITFTSDSDADEDNTEISIKEYIEKYNVTSAFIYMIIDRKSLSDNAASELIDTLAKINSEYGIETVVSGYVFADNYGTVADELKDNPDPTTAWLKKRYSVAQIGFAVKDGVSNTSQEKLAELLNG